MPFKIVKTNENNKDKLFAVPSFWEDKNILKWPRKNEAKHLKNQSIPEADWKQLRCMVKRRNIPSYETAEYVLQEMLNHTETEDDTNTSKNPISEKPLQELNLNIIADEIVYPTASGSNNIIVEKPAASESNHITSEMLAAPSVGMDNIYEYQFVQDNQSTTDQHQCCTNLGQNLAIQNIILDNQTQILNELKGIKNVQNIIIQKVALFSIQLNDTVSQITQASDSNFQVNYLNECTSTPSNTAFYVKPVNNIQQLHELEQQLSESSVRQKMKNTYLVLCNGGKGIDCAYTLADILFSRDFLCQCTWSGGSRGSDTKIAWKSFKNILSFFWELVHSWDKTYTIYENESFFKNILKNSKKRKLAKNIRASTSQKLFKAENANNDFETSDEDTKEAEKQGDIDEENKVHSKNSSNDEESDMNEENVKTNKKIEYEYKGDENCVIESNDSFDPIETNKEVDNIEKNTINSKENEEDGAVIKKMEKEQSDDKKITIDTLKVPKSEENTLNEPKNKNKSIEPSYKNILKKKIVRISKKNRDKIRLLKIKKNQAISHKNISGSSVSHNMNIGKGA